MIWVMRMSRILITGGAGFIGSNLAEQLMKGGNEVVLLDRKNNPQNIRYFEDELEYVSMDVCDPRGVGELLQANGINGVVHLAAVSRVVWGEEQPEECHRTNVDGTANLLKAIRESGKRPWVIFGSSREVYGEPTEFPVKEDHKKAPMNLYGRTKLEGENMIRDFSAKNGSHSAILRFSNVYGNERDILDRVIPRFVLSGLKDQPIEIHGGGQFIDFTHINDTVEGIIRTIHMLEKKESDPSSTGGYGNGWCDDFHLLPGKPFTLQQVAASITDHLETDVPIRYGEARNYDVERFHGDPKKAERKLGFKARIAPEIGIPMTIDRFRMVMET
jgi:nucleoside-diphosphate-sugar epimerase